MTQIDKNLKPFILENGNIELITPFNVIHDEVDVLIDNTLLKPIINGLYPKIKLPELSEIHKLPYIKFRFDIEYDLKGSTFLPQDSYNPYKSKIKYIHNQIPIKGQK